MADARVLGIEPGDEEATTEGITMHRRRVVYSKLEDQGQLLDVLVKVGRIDVIEKLRDVESKLRYVTASGHGNTSTLFGGIDGNAIFLFGDTALAVLRGKVVHLLACDAGEKLGKYLTGPEVGCAAFFGYKDDFGFYPLNSDKPEIDADIIMQCDSEIDLAFAEGLNAREVHQRVTRRWEAVIEEVYPEKPYLASMLSRNLERLCSPVTDLAYGSGDASIL